MGVKGREAREHIERHLAEFGVPRPWEFGFTGGAHQEVRFVYLGRKVRFVFPGSPSDRRAFKNARTELRKILRATEGKALPAGPAERPVLDAGGVLPREPHDVGGRRGRVHDDTQALAYAGAAGLRSLTIVTPRS